MCKICRKRSPKNELLRFIIKDNVVSFDKSQKAQARGTYICEDCLPLVSKRKVFKNCDIKQITEMTVKVEY
jgi:predicted RNA-binding protein YlxR (DUF448 family)